MNALRAGAALIVVATVAAGCGEPVANRTPVLTTSVSALPPASTPPSPSSAPASGSVAPRSSARPSASPGTPPAPAGDPGGLAEGTQPGAGPLTFLRVIDLIGSDGVGQTNVTFHLTEHCAVLHGPPEKAILLTFLDGQAWVDPAVPSTVEIREPESGKLVRITDGERVSLGGVFFDRAGSGLTPPPHPSCPPGDVFLVTEVR